jgi:hypothetical protein
MSPPRARFGLVRGRVFQRTKGRGKPWSYVVDVGVGANGKRRQRLKGGFHTRAELPMVPSLRRPPLRTRQYVLFALCGKPLICTGLYWLVF